MATETISAPATSARRATSSTSAAPVRANLGGSHMAPTTTVVPVTPAATIVSSS